MSVPVSAASSADGGCLCGAVPYRLTSTETLDIITVSLDDPTLFPPTRELRLDHRLPWAAVDAALAHYPQDSGFDPD